MTRNVLISGVVYQTSEKSLLDILAFSDSVFYAQFLFATVETAALFECIRIRISNLQSLFKKIN